MAEASNSVFISYRREASWTLVEALHQRLTDAGIDVFYDIESIRGGEFEQIIINQIRARPYFVLVLTPGALDRANDDGDWLRREIQTAVDCGRVIVPVHTPTFDLATLPTALPGGLGQKIAGFQAQELPHKFFKYAVTELAEQYLVPIDLAVEATPVEDQADVARLRRAAAETPTVTQEQLTAQEYFERALGRLADDDLIGAIADYDGAIRLNPDDAFAHVNRGAARYGKGDLDGAIADYDEAIRIKPEHAGAYRNRATARYDQGDLDGAIADYDEAIRCMPEYAGAYNNRGLARAGKGDLVGACADYDEAIRLDPEHAGAHSNRGALRYGRGDLDGAIADYDNAIRLNPDDGFDYSNRGAARLGKGDLDGAIADYDEAIRLDPNDDFARQWREEALKALRSR